MQKYFHPHYDGPPFDPFGPGHLVVLGVVVAAVVFLIWGWRNAGDHAKRRTRLLLAALILFFESSWHAWRLYHGTWNIQVDLPLHTCSVSIWCSIYMLATRSCRVYEILYFIGIAGAIQAVLTPNLGVFGLPHFWAIQSLSSHGLLIIALVYMTTIEGFRPTWKSIWLTMLVVNVYMLIVTAVNYLIGSNYMYTLHKPPTASLLDVMGPWPWYILAGEALALLFFLLLYLPIAVSTRRQVSPEPHS